MGQAALCLSDIFAMTGVAKHYLGVFEVKQALASFG
jgi:hypothetical protein